MHSSLAYSTKSVTIILWYMNINICMKKCKMGLEEMIIKRLFKAKNFFRNQMALPHKTAFLSNPLIQLSLDAFFNIFTI